MSYALGLKCLKCGAEYSIDRMFEGCPECKTDKIVANLTVIYDYDKIAQKLSKEVLEKRSRRLGIWRFKEMMPIKNEKHMLSLGEGNTPLIKCERLGKGIGISNIYVKDESRSPTWSFKDRLCCVAISKGLDFRAKVATVSSTGNHGAATAAYSAKAGMDCIIFTLPSAPQAMSTLMQVYGAKVVSVSTSEGRWMLMGKCIKDYGWYPTGTFTLPTPTGNPYGAQGYKSIGFEICEQLSWEAPDKVIMPTGYGEGIFGTWSGFKEFYEMGFINTLPEMISTEPARGGPLANAISKDLNYIEKVPLKPSVAFSIATSITSYQALKAIRDSRGLAITATDKEIMAAQKMLASMEGLYAEPAAAASVAGAKRLREEGKIDEDETIVCVATSSGLKDIEATRRLLPSIPTIEPDWYEFKKFMKSHYSLII